MTFQIHALPKTPFASHFAQTSEALREQGIYRVTADADHGYPCRISLADAKRGETLLLLNYSHLDGCTPYAASHAIYVGQTAEPARLAAGVVPDMIGTRQISLRGFDEDKLMQVGEVVQGSDVRDVLRRVFADPAIRFVDLHSAMRGCFLARATPLQHV